MKTAAAAAAALVVTVLAVALSGADTPSDRAYVGEVRAMAVARGNQDAIARLHRDGWLEANGQVLPVADFPELYGQIGRTWTADGVATGRFALPRLPALARPLRSSDNPYGVLGPGDLVSSGAPRADRAAPISYWIFAGRPGPDVR